MNTEERTMTYVNVEHETVVRGMLTTVERTAKEDVRHTPNDLAIDDITDVSEAVEIWRAADRQLQAAKIVRDVAAEQLAGLLGVGGAARIGDQVVRYKTKRTERCIDPDSVTAYLTAQVKSDFVNLADVMNPNLYKKSWMIQSVRETFYEWTDDSEPTLQTVPVEKAPKFLQTLKDGETHGT